MDIEKEISKIDGQISKYRDKIHKLLDKKEKLKFKQKNLEGKFIKRNGEYMFVTWQTEDNIRYKDGIMLQGLSFTTSLSDYYNDCAWVSFDALNEWYIPKDLFFKDDEFEIITKEEFINKFKESFKNSIDFGLLWIDKTIRNYSAE